LVSGNGTDLQSIIDAIKDGSLKARINLVLSNNPNAFALTRARRENIPTVIHSSSDYKDKETFRRKFLEIIIARDINLLVLAGYIKKLPNNIIEHFKGRIINIHPALLPKYGGKGYYGIRVHQAVIESGDETTGVTVHFVNEKYDNGAIIYQETVPVHPNDTPETLAERVLEVEHRVLPQAISLFAEGKIGR